MNDDLVGRVAETIARDSPCQMRLDEAMSLARAAIAIIAPAVREECVKVAEMWSRDGQSPTAHGIIEGIRAGVVSDA